MHKVFFILVCLLLVFPAAAVTPSLPDVTGHWRVDTQRSTGRYGAFALPDQELVISKTKVGFAVHMSSASKGWALDDHYILDGKEHPVEIMSPDGMRLVGTRQVQMSTDKRGVQGVEHLTTRTILGKAKVKREFQLQLDKDGRLILDSVEDTPLGQKSVHSVFEKTKS
jgi:hypothetical protein